MDGAITRYIYDGDQVICETDGSGTITAKYVYGAGIDEVVTMQRGGSAYFYHYDGLGNVSDITDGAGSIVESYSYDAYGNSSDTSSVGNPYLFNGRRFDAETGLYYYRARYYDSEIGRFLQVDPIGYIGGMNLYVYCSNNPVNFIDVFGLFHFGKRPLTGAPWIPGASSNPIDDYFNTEVSHEHGFFDDGSGKNIGFGPEGRFSEDATGKGYRYDDKHYDDDLIREALKNIEDGDYSLLGIGGKKKNNCQDWADRLRSEYDRLRKQEEGVKGK